jgi:eukaryotic-like serine/threonine-protein kinase
MGVVYEAFDTERRERVACKTLARPNALGVYGFKNEFRALCEAAHPNLVRLHELFIEQSTLCFTMELVDGQPFDRFVRPDSRCDMERLLGTLPQLFRAVNAIHAAGKLHRDLKPSNVLVTAEGRVVVLDFGLVSDSDVGGVGQTSSAERRCGTPAYMAPEQAAGCNATEASDLYAIGVMLFEALTGRLPFEGREGEILASKQHREAPRAGSLAPVSEALDALCSALLSREPQARTERHDLELSPGLLAGATARSSSWKLQHADGSSAPAPRRELVGRNRELEQLHEAFRETVAGQPVVLFVSGESGIGKTALVSAFVADIEHHMRATVLTGRCYARENVPYQGFDSLIDSLSRHLHKLPAPEAAVLLPREVYALARIFPALQRVSAIAEAPSKLVPDLQDLKRRAFAALAELLARMRDRAPLLMTIDDGQWFDQDSVHLLRALLVRSDPIPMLLVCVHRGESAENQGPLCSVQAAVRENPALEARSLALGPLEPSSMVEWLEARLPSPKAPGVARALAAESLGSPFFAMELARALPLRSAGAPLPSLDDALSLHLSTLPLECRRLLAVLGLAAHPLAPALLIDAANVSEGHAHLDRLQREQLVRVWFNADRGRSVECYHDKIREHVTSSLDSMHRRELSLALARALCSCPGAHVDLLSRMLVASGLSAEAAEHTQRAAKQAFDALAFDRAAKLYARALEQGKFDDGRRHELLVARAKALACAGYGELAGEALLEAASGSDTHETLALTREAAEQFLMCGQLVRGRATLAQACSLAGVAFPNSLGSALASVAWSRTRFRVRGLSFVPKLQQDTVTTGRLELLRSAAYCLLRTDVLRGADYSARAAHAALAAGDRVEIGRTLANELMLAGAMSASTERIEELRLACAQVSEQTGDALSRFGLAFALGGYRITTGDPSGALIELDRACDLINANPGRTSSYDRAWTQSYRAMSLLLCGRVTEAGELAQVQLEEALARGDYTVSANLTQVACYAAIGADRPAHAAELLAQSACRLVADEPNVLDFLWLCVQPLPQLYRGQAADAWAAAATERDRYASSFAGRVTLRGLLENESCGLAVAAAAQTSDSKALRRLQRTAKTYGAIATQRSRPIGAGVPDAALACMCGDRSRAISSLRARVASRMSPILTQLARRRLGEVLGGDEGERAIRQADAFLRAGGVVDPARFTAALTPGIAMLQ